MLALQLVSINMEKAFDRAGHHIIVQALSALGARNHDRAGLLISIKTGSGKGACYTASCSLLQMEPLNRLLTTAFRELIYTTMGLLLYSDDNLTPPSLEGTKQILPILSVYVEYTGWAG
jgi:hypothetical protein